MRINPDKCVACGNCTYVCPMGAIYIDPSIKRATVNLNECVECYACFNGMSQEHLNPTMVRTIRKVFQWMRLRFDPEPDVCPTAAFEPEPLAWPRVVRRALDRKSTRLNSSHVEISYAVFCLKKKKNRYPGSYIQKKKNKQITIV